MNTKILRRVRELYNSPFVPAHVNRANQLKWVHSVRQLGDRWLYAQTVQFNKPL